MTATCRRRPFRRLLNLERFEDRLAPALITVSNLNASGAGSLRDAIGSANSTPGADTIDFAPGLTGVINLNPGVGGTSLNINEAVTIFGPGAGVISVTANGKSRVFNLSGAANGAAISISGLTISGGRAIGTASSGGVGAGIYVVNENLTIDRCNISGNVADKSGGGIAIGEHFYTTGVGGSATVSIYNSTISGNSALEGSGGGISAYGEAFGAYSKRTQSLWVENCTISGNTADWTTDQTTYVGGGGVSFLGKVGPGYLVFANTTITNNKVTNGAVGAAILGIQLNGTINLLNSTVAYNEYVRSGSGAIRIQQNFNTSAGNVQAQSSIIANTTQTGGTQHWDLSAKYATSLVGTTNIIGNSTFTGILVPTGNQVGTDAAPLDSQLGPLQSNGGPSATRMPLLGSPAINKGTLSSLYMPTNDGRGPGYPRSLDGAVDVGAVECTDWVVRNNQPQGSGSLLQRIVDANAFVGEQTITFDSNAFPSNGSNAIPVQSKTPISDSLTITGPGATALALKQGSGSETMFAVAAAAGAGDVITFSGLTFDGSSSTLNGGVIRAKDQTLNFTDCVFSNNNAPSGGAIAFDVNTAGQLSLLRCSFNNNVGDLNGGAVFFAGGGTVSIADSTFSGNLTKSGTGNTQGGGAVAFVGTASAPLLVRNSTFANNKSAGQGGAIFLTSFAGTLNVENSTIAFNSAAGTFGGGGIGRTASTGDIALASTILSNNTNSGGIHPDIFSSGTVTANFSAIGNPGNTFVTADATTVALVGQNFRLGTLGKYGGPTNTIPLLPGSAAANKGAASGLTLDQRGLPRSVGGTDIGAFEGQGFTLSVVSGTPQTTVTNLAFGGPLVTKVVAANAVEPVDGGVVTFVAPASGASAVLGSPVAVIAAGSALTTATANGIGGSYNVTASVGSLSVNFDLTNKAPETPSLIVSTNSDIVDNFDNKTSLREAIALANSKAGADTITFDAAVFAAPQIIALTNGELSVNDAVTITGPGAALATVSGNKLGRVFNTTAAAANAAINVSGLTITGAQTLLRGGAVFADDQVVTFTDCVLSGNSSGAGGAIAFDITTAGRLVLQRTTVSNNTASFGGGGVYFFGGGSFLVQNSTFSGNKSNGTIINNGGGGIYFNGGGGSKLLEIRNSTISGNSAASDGGGLCFRNHGGNLYMVNSTVVNNTSSGPQGGGGIAQVTNTGTWNFGSCIISNNNHTAGPAEDLFNVAAGFGGQLDSCAVGTIAGTTGLTLSATTQALLGQNFLLSALGNFGGATQTHALLPGSPAINKGTNNLSLATDQRGQSRVAVGNPDIGAFESQGFTVSVVSGSPQSTNINTAFANPLVAKVTAVNAAEPVDAGVVAFAAPGSGASAALGSPAAVVASGSASTTATANGTAGAFNVSASVAGSSVNFALTIKAPEAPSLVVTTNVDVVDSFDNKTSLREALTFANSTPGAATVTFDSTVFATPQTITLASTLALSDTMTLAGPGANLLTVSGNKAVRVMTIDTPTSGQKITVSGLTIANGFSNQGGGVFIGNEVVAFNNCAIVNNAASASIGAVFIGTGASVVFDRCTVTGNSAPTLGAIYTASPLAVRNCTIANNSATAGAAGALEFGGAGSLSLENSTVVGNSAVTSAGGISARSPFTSTASVISGNTVGATANDVSFLFVGNVVTAINSAIGSISPAGAISDKGGNLLNQPHASLRLAPLGSYGGPTQTIALLPGSPLIDAGSSTITLDQRGLGRVGTPDIGAFESQGFAVNLVSGSPQSTVINTAFAAPLSVMVTANNPAEPVNGGVVSFTRPATGPSAALATPTATIAAGAASTKATANAAAGSYVVSAKVGGSSVNFNLTNTSLEPQSLVVNTDQDLVSDSDFQTSLREAIAYANSLAGADTVSFDPNVFSTAKSITLTGAEIAINDAITVAGPGAALLAINGNNAGRIFNTISAPTNSVVTIQGVTLTGGNGIGASPNSRGGAIVAGSQQIFLTDSVVTGNKAGVGGAIGFSTFGAGRLNLQRSTISNNIATQFSGAVDFVNSGGFTIENSTLSGNQSSADGGAIGVFGTLYVGLIRNSTISGNIAAGSGGAISLYSSLTPATLSIVNSTIANNTSGGIKGGAVAAEGSKAAAVVLDSSIVSNNLHTGGSNPDFNTASTVTANFSAVGSKNGAATFVADATTTTLLGQNFKLGTLADNGGPTQTIALLSGSPLINAGSNTASLAFDQRGFGFARVSGGLPDIGAFEFQSAPPAKVRAVQINDGSAQRSRIVSMKIEFDQNVGTPASSAFQLVNQKTGQLPTVSAAVDNLGLTTIVILTFSGASVDNGSLADGRHTLTIQAAGINGGQFDGNGDGAVGDNYVLVGDPATNKLFRLFGDADGDGDVDIADFAAFRGAFSNTSNLSFDSDGDGDVDLGDFAAFRQRFGTSI